MKEFLILVAAYCGIIFTTQAQSRGIRIGYIDMEYILENVSDYKDAKAQLEQKAQKWKQEIDTKSNEIKKLKEALNTEKVILTKELIEEKEEEIAFKEQELIAYQEKRFGPTGDLIVQKAVLVKPIQDQVFTAVQDIAEAKKYDFVLDKSSDLTLIFAAKRFDISDQVIRSLTRASKRKELSKVELKKLEKEEYLEDLQDESSEHSERQKILDEKKAARQKLIDDKKAEREKLIQERKEAAEAKKAAAKEAAEAKRNKNAQPKVDADKKEDALDQESNSSDDNKKARTAPTSETSTTEAKDDITPAQKKQQDIDQRKKELEEKKAKVLADREAAKQAQKDKIEENKKQKEEQKEEQNNKN